MTAAVVRELGLPVEYRGVQVDTAWSRSNALYTAKLDWLQAQQAR